MNWPQEDGKEAENKFVFAQRLAAGLAYTSLTSNDRMMLTAINDTGVSLFGPARGRGRGVEMLNFVGKLKTSGVTDLNKVLVDYALRVPRPGLLFIISDMFSPTGHMDGINALLSKGYDVVVLHLLSPDEIDPPLAGDLRLIDIETGTPQEVTIDGPMRAIYTERLNSWRDSIRTDVMRRGGHYVFIETTAAWERIVLQDLRRMGLLK
jgi:uncharacterized protein (DUF58 family)